MNKMIKALIVAALAVSAQNVLATETNKTFLTPRNQGFTLPLEQTGWNMVNEKIQDRFGGHFQAIGFYGQSTKNAETGKYFGILGKNSIVIGTDIAGQLLYNAAGADFDSTVKIEPNTVNYGADLAYFQDLSKVVNGLYLKVNLPVMYVENDMKLTCANADVKSFLAGTRAEVAVNTAKASKSLTNALIDGKKHSKTGVANVDVLVGYKFLNKESYHAALNLGVVIPTGEASKGVYAYEPMVGSNHFGFGGGLDAQARVWGEEDHNVVLNFAANYRYFFQATEKRTLGLTGLPFGQYRALIPFVAAKLNTVQCVPAANLLTLDVDVTPKHNLDGIIALAYNKGVFTFDLGYNLFFKDTESIKYKSGYTDASYALAGPTSLNMTASTNNVDDLTGDSATVGDGLTVASNVDTTAASTPSQFTNGVYGAVNYAFKDWEYPVSLGLGGKYDFAAKNSAVEGWQGWVKAGLSF